MLEQTQQKGLEQCAALATQTLAEGIQRQSFRDGNNVVVPKGALLPPYCVKCGNTEVTRVDKSFSWLNPSYYLLLFLGLGIGLVYLIFRKRVVLAVPLCEPHRQYIRKLKIAATVLLVGCVPVGVLLGFLIGEPDGDMWGLLIGVLMLFGGLISVLVRRPLNATHIDKDRATLAGACEAFLSKLTA